MFRRRTTPASATTETSRLAIPVPPEKAHNELAPRRILTTSPVLSTRLHPLMGSITYSALGSYNDVSISERISSSSRTKATPLARSKYSGKRS